MKIFIACQGSVGDVFPFFVIGSELKSRGHDVTLIANTWYQTYSQLFDLDFYGFDQDRDKVEETAVKWKASQSTAAVIESEIMPAVKNTFTYIIDNMEEGNTLIVSTFNVLGGKLAHVKLNIPHISILINPDILPINSAWQKAWNKELYSRLEKFCDAFSIVLPRKNLFNFTATGDKTIALFPGWFTEDRNKNLKVEVDFVGFPHMDSHKENSIFNKLQMDSFPESLNSFLNNDKKTVVFTPGTFNRDVTSFFNHALSACEKFDIQGVFLTFEKGQLPAELPDNVRYFDFLPLNLLLKKSALLVSSGGIGSCAEAIAAGIPHLVLPVAYDQHYNAKRVKLLKVGNYLVKSEMTRKKYLDSISALLHAGDARIHHLYSNLITSNDAIGKTCDLIEQECH